jgi:hypothetical protein
MYLNTADQHRLTGAGIEIFVGPTDASLGPSKSWSVPKALLPYFSPFLRAACERDFKERQENKIYLPKDEPAIFSLFVEWMYYNNYSLNPELVASNINSANFDAKAWVLGDKLLCTSFKNYAMTRLVTQHIRLAVQPAQSPAYEPVRTVEIDYACSNSPPGSKLRHFFFNIVSTHFANPEHVQGTVHEWDQVLQQHDDARIFVLKRFKKASNERGVPKKLADYLDSNDDVRTVNKKLSHPQREMLRALQ